MIDAYLLYHFHDSLDDLLDGDVLDDLARFLCRWKVRNKTKSYIPEKFKDERARANGAPMILSTVTCYDAHQSKYHKNPAGKKVTFRTTCFSTSFSTGTC